MKIALGVEYFGKNFHGWQVQKSGLRTVQSSVEASLSKVANHPVRVFCSGRTDSGVHAMEQVIHFETSVIRTERAWLFGGNVNLPSDVNFNWLRRSVMTFMQGLVLLQDPMNTRSIIILLDHHLKGIIICGSQDL